MYLAPAQQYKSNLEKFGHGNWYGWCEEHWGTKWNAQEARVDSESDALTVRFTCASSFAKPVVVALSRQWPQLQIRVLYADEFKRRAGDYTLKGGRQVEKIKRTPGDILKEIVA